MTSQPTLFTPLQHRTFRLFWVANLSTGLGIHIQAVGAAWLMATISSSADMVALVQTAATLPYMLFSIVAGVIADHFSKRTVILGATSFMFATSILLATAAFTGPIAPWALLAFTFLTALGGAVFYPAMAAAVGEMVPRSQLPAAIALNSLAYNLTRSVGPATGGIIVTVAGTAAAFVVNSLSYLTLLFVMLRWRPQKSQTKAARIGMRDSFVGGFRYVAGNTDVQRIYLRGFLFGFSAISFLAMLPLIVRDALGGEAALFGTLSACFGAGAVAGAMLGPYLRARLRTEPLIRLSFASMAISAITCAFSPWPVLTALALLLAGVAWVAIMARLSVNVQVSSPAHVVGRVLAFHQMASFGSMALGSWLWGSLTEQFGPSVTLLVCAATFLASAAVGLVAPLALGDPSSSATSD